MATSTIKSETVAPTITVQANSAISAQVVGRTVIGTASFEAVSQGWFTRGTITPAPKRTITISAVKSTLETGAFRITTEGNVQVWNGSTTIAAFNGIPFCYDF